jgi:hypothetical protein
MRQVFRTFAALVALCTAGGTAGAQQVVEERTPPGWVFTPAIGAGGSWDTNVLLADPNSEPPGDYATPLYPSGTLEFRGKRTRVSSAYDGAFTLYRTFEQLNSSEHRVRGEVEHRASSRLLLSADADWSRVPTTDALIVAGLPFFRVGSRMGGFGTGFEALVARHTMLSSRYTLRTVDFEEGEFATSLLGGREHEVAVTLARALSPRLTIGGEFGIRRADIRQISDEFGSYTGSATIEYEISPSTSIAGGAGVSRLDPGLTLEPRIGPAIRASLTRRARLLVMSVAYQRSFVPSFGFGGTFQNEEVQATVHVPFARSRAYVDGSVARFNAEPLVETQPDLRSFWLSGTVGYRFTRWLSGEGFYSHTDQNTQVAGGKLGRRQIGFRMRATKPVKLD